MKAHLVYLLHNLRESFWFVPALMTSVAVALSMLTLAIDSNPTSGIARLLPWSDGLDLSNARLIMSTIAGSIITVASLVFSLTVLSLSLASGQLGPRLLSLFMQDRFTQTVHGAFIATFVFALLVLANLGDRSALVPKASIAVALAMTLLSFAALVAFIHHLARSLHADEAIARMARELDAHLGAMYGSGSGQSGPQATSPSQAGADWAPAMSVPSSGSGYVQTIDRGALVEVARCHGTQIRLRYRAGHFVCRDAPLADLADGCDEAMLDEVCGCIVLGSRRTSAEDPEFAFQAIVEIGLRALSPGINDPYTACSCIDWLADGLTCVMRTPLPGPVYKDASGNPRLHVMPLTLDGFFDTAFNQIRQVAEGNVAVLIRLGDAYGRLAVVARSREQRDIIARHTRMLERTCARSIVEPDDQSDVHDRLSVIEAALAE